MHDYACKTTVKWNGEDIFLGLALVQKHTLKCYAVQSLLINLENDTYAISSHKMHIPERTTFLNLSINRYKITDFFTPILISNTLTKTLSTQHLYVRCSEGFGNQLRMLLAGVYLKNNGYILSYTQEWVLSNHNNVNFLDYFEIPKNINIVGNIHTSNILRECTFRKMIQQYSDVCWKQALVEAFKYLIVKPHIQIYVDHFVHKYNINNIIGVHARRTCKPALLSNQDNTNRVLPISNKDLLKMVAGHSSLFLATDNKETQQLFIQNTNTNIIVVESIVTGIEVLQSPYNSKSVVRHTTDLHTVLDFLILKYCNTFIGSNESAFSLLVYYWRNNKQDTYVHGKL